MEQPPSSLAYRGSVVEAITEAKRQKKIFVVYIAVDNEESRQLETSTWKDSKVCEITRKYCILLHILEGSSEAQNFAAIYPQSYVPCITAVGYNGVQLWKNDGFVSADVLASSLEKAWLSLHVQETTAAFLTAALASKNQVVSAVPEGSSSQQVTSEANVSSSSDNIASLNAGQPVYYGTIEDRKTEEDTSKDLDSKKDYAVHEPNVANMSGGSDLDGSMPETKPESSSGHPTEVVQSSPEVDVPVQENSSRLSSHQLGNISEVSQETSNQVSDVVHPSTVEITSKIDEAEDYGAKSNDVFLNIRLPDGVSLQSKFSIMDTLEMVKDYIDQNRTNNFGSFSIAIPYPRKVFTDQDMNRTLSELGFFNRQALVVVQHNQISLTNRGVPQYQSPARPASSAGQEGYWASIKGILSYANPFSYFGGSSSSTAAAQESPSGIWQYGPNSTRQTTLRGSTASNSTNASRGNASSSSRRQQASARFGGNIHTLKHDEDDDSRFSDRNTFWNGNSTQFGGNDDDSK